MFGLDAETLKELSRHGTGFLLGCLMFLVWLNDKRTQQKRDREDKDRLEVEAQERADRDALHIKRLEDILRERKSDRDAMLTLMGRIEAHLARTDQFEKFSREVLREADSPSPKRRYADHLLAEGIAESLATAQQTSKSRHEDKV